MNHDAEDLEFQPAPPDKLYTHNRRQLSAMLDGELSPDQARFMLRRLQHDTDLADCWERWQVCGDVLRGHGHALLPADFSRRVALAIAAPDAGSANGTGQALFRRPRARLVRWGGGALAASMALVALFMARQLPDSPLPATAGGGELVAQAIDAPPGAREVRDSLARVPDTAAPTAVPGPLLAGNEAPASQLPEGSEGAWAATTSVAVAEVPRRAAERRSRGQSQRAARRVAASTPVRARAVAGTSMTPGMGPTSTDDAVGLLADLPDARAFGAPFGAQAVAPSRPWPRAVLPGLAAGNQPFAARYGLPSAPSDAAFAPFQPRLVEPSPVRQSVVPGADARDARPEPGTGTD
ncbi:hypothetical protein H5368_00600 [Luteimonas sp. MC1782]|uniref:sigma-E factor negative regulatory protein n=1 Tax=Luteimonas sp. MC1782 TaxID=2760305 RepID=UPI00160117DB|nr:sigma-E factor negative regulatory protein [Luteimonas sp. MC1782]MBB1471525.1 hypothetical protein [Luteimonas sp. MC1782]